MNTTYSTLLSTRISSSRPRLILNDSSSSSMHRIKLNRGLVQHSLLYCLEKGYFTLIRYLIESGHGNIRERDHDGRTVLIYCCFIENDCWAEHMAMFLLENGARISDRDHRGLNALHYAIVRQRFILVKRFLASLDFNLHRSIDIYGNTCLHYACSTGHIEIVRAIVDVMKRYSIDLNTKNQCGSTAYDVACHFNHLECQNFLRNEMVLREQNSMSSISTVPMASKLSKGQQQRISTAGPIRPRTSTLTSQPGASAVSIPTLTTNSASMRKQSASTSHVTSEISTQPMPLLIDPIQNRFVTLKHNAQLDQSLVNQLKVRSEFHRRSFLGSTLSLNESSNTWRSDFSKIYQQLQSDKTSSYRQSFQTLTAIQLANEAAIRAQNVVAGGKHDPASSTQVQSFFSTSGSLKGISQRRNSITSIKSNLKPKKVNFN